MQAIHFAQKVGVAPSTTTIALKPPRRGLGDCFPTPSVEERDRYIFSPRPWRRAYSMRNEMALQLSGSPGLGVVNPTDAWQTGRTGRVYGTTAVRYWKNGQGGYNSEVVDSNGPMLGADPSSPGLSTGAKIGIGAAALTGIGALIYAFTRGR